MHSAGPSEEVAGHETNIPNRCVGRFDSLPELRTYVVYMSYAEGDTGNKCNMQRHAVSAWCVHVFCHIYYMPV